MNLLGMNIGKCRMPLVDMSPANLDVLKKALVNYGLLKND
jgi:4-hydroxy-tetrahydrodipicolinate synthase